MNQNIIGLRLEGGSAGECSESARRILSSLSVNGVTYNQMLFPYADSLTLSGGVPGMFGSHILLWDVDPRLLARCTVRSCGDAVSARAREYRCSARELAGFFEERPCSPPQGYMLAGRFSDMLAGAVSPWAIRGRARVMCSFAEHTARLKGARVGGFCGDRLAVSGVPESEIINIFESKTGSICSIIPPCEAAAEVSGFRGMREGSGLL